MPKRVGVEGARAIMSDRLPLLTHTAVATGLIA